MKYLLAIKNFLSGKKTYAIVVLGAAYELSKVFGYVVVSPDEDAAIRTLVLAIFGITLRAGVASAA